MPNKKKKASTSQVGSAIMERRYMIGPNMNFAAAEAYKLLRTNIMFSFSGQSVCHVIGMTSSFRGEGKSLTSINLAYSLAEAQKRILLIEGDMRLPTMASRLNLASTPGLSNLLVGLNSISEATQQFVSTMEDGKSIVCDVLVSGDIPPNPSELLGSDRMQVLLEKLRERYDYIILDLPPVTAVTDAAVASKLVDGMVIVVRENTAIRGALAESIRQLRLVNTRILGFTFNGASESGSGYYKGKYYYRKHYYKNYYNSYYQK